MQAHQPPPRLKNTADPDLPWFMGLRAPKEYACPLSTSPYYLPRKMREEVNLEEISMDFDDWVYNSPNKDLWSFAFMKDWKFGFSGCLGRVFSISSYYKEGLRAIFGHVYTETVVGGRYRPKLGTLIRQCNGVISIDTSNSSTEPVNSSNILETIDTLVMLVKHVIDSVPLNKPSAYPDEVTRFFDLCRLPRRKSDLEIQRTLLYCICKNPLIFYLSDAVNFCWKASNLDGMCSFSTLYHTYKAFRDRLRPLWDFCLCISKDSGPFYEVGMYNCPMESESFVPTEYYYPFTVVRLFGNCMRHIQDTCPHYTHCEIMRCLIYLIPGIVSILFYALAGFMCDPRWFPLVDRWTTYKDFLDEGNSFCPYFKRSGVLDGHDD
ncbi:hypothetical protein DM860_017273 [Cuscuta australis]|uniref:Uncharacterized protein n=1 Tax=Cuscuta australis TaxID=267555 RepID=A0A328E7I8_9ASTE|nr:hypothetical protein DM860_017273 [Cuscuta australis]